MAGDERKALIVSDLLQGVNSAIDGSGRISPWLEERAAILGDALEEYGYPTLALDFATWFDNYGHGNRWQSMPRWNVLSDRIQRATRELATGDHDIRDPNISGQGYAPSHVESPFHRVLLDNGFTYSHSTRVWRPYYGAGISDVRVGPEHVLWHTYRLGPRTVSVGLSRRGLPMWESGILGQGRRTEGDSVEQLRRYLLGARKREAARMRRR